MRKKPAHQRPILSAIRTIVWSPVWSQVSSFVPNEDYDLRQAAAVWCQSACPPRVSVLTADFHAFAKYSTAQSNNICSRNTSSNNTMHYSATAICAPAPAQPISDNPVCCANNRDVCGNMLFPHHVMVLRFSSLQLLLSFAFSSPANSANCATWNFYQTHQTCPFKIS